MLKEWDFLLAEIWVLLVLAALIGLIAGWLIWGGRADKMPAVNGDEVSRLRAELKREKARGSTMSSDPLDDIPAMEGGGYKRPASLKPTEASPEPVRAAPPIKPEPAPASPAIPEPEKASAPIGKPAGLTSPRDGMPDDLTKISGVGPKMEKICNALGFWHFDQIAGWSAGEISWVDDNLEGFKGRVTRDKWVQQASDLAQNKSPAFVRRKD